MDKVDCLRDRVEPFAVLFWAPSNVYLPIPDCARQPDITLHKACPYMVIVGSFLNEDAVTALSYLGMLFIYAADLSYLTFIRNDCSVPIVVKLHMCEGWLA